VTGSWQDLVAAEQAYFAARMALYKADPEAELRAALGSARGRGTALRALRDAPVELVMDLIEPLTEAATTTHGEVGLAREVLGRVDPGWLAGVLPPLVEQRLAPAADWEDYRRLAELLSTLGQHALLAEVVRRAAGSDDEDIREVAADFQ
jgi:hypothetical protein